MGAVVQKVLREPVQLVILAPYWPKQGWFLKLERLAEDSFFIYRAETEYLPRQGKPVPFPPRWDTILFRVDTLRKARMVDEKGVRERWDTKKLRENQSRHPD